MNAYVSKEELTLLRTNQVAHPEHYADARGQRRGGFASVIRAIGAYFERHRILSELNGLTDRELADIGLNRGDLPRVFGPAVTR